MPHHESKIVTSVNSSPNFNSGNCHREMRIAFSNVDGKSYNVFAIILLLLEEIEKK